VRRFDGALVVGVDCAVNPANMGLSLGYCDGREVTIERVVQGSASVDPHELVADWIQRSEERVLLAVDAPLGWPIAMAEELPDHRAGKSFSTSPNGLFRRATDQFIHEKTGKQPLDVGADRIARAGYSALDFIERLRKSIQTNIDMVWSPNFSGIGVIEVYPAATLRVHGIDSKGYKNPGGKEQRKRVLERLSEKLLLVVDVPSLEKRSDTVDAVACALAGEDFLRGNCYCPPSDVPFEKEGWIWVRK